MNHDRTYRPAHPVPAPRLRDADGSIRQAPRRSAGYAATHPVQPLKGLPGTRATDVSYRASVPAGHAGRGVALSYRALAPGGAGFCCRICAGTSESRLTAHYSLLTANSSYTFSAKEKDAETGLSYFGSRYYSSDLSVWLSVDPMSDKYPSLSPYTYCADNPVKLVDPNGEEIWIIGEDGNKYKYYNGCFYACDGNKVTPKSDSFLSTAANAIDKLKETKTGNRLISFFEGPENKDVIIENSSRITCDNLTIDANTGDFISQTIRWNSEGTEIETTAGKQKNSTTDLGHEFSHVYDNAKKVKGLNDLCPNKGIRSEWRAVYRENLMRRELGLPYRTGYTFKNPDNSTYFVPMLRKGEPYMPNSLQWTPFEICKKKRN